MLVKDIKFLEWLCFLWIKDKNTSTRVFMHREQLPVQTQQPEDKRCRRGCPLPVSLLERREKSETWVKTHVHANVFVHRVTSLTRSPNSLVRGENLEIRDNHGWYVPSKVVLQPMTVHFEIWSVSLRQFDGTIWKDFCSCGWACPTGFKFPREDL